MEDALRYPEQELGFRRPSSSPANPVATFFSCRSSLSPSAVSLVPPGPFSKRGGCTLNMTTRQAVVRMAGGSASVPQGSGPLFGDPCRSSFTSVVLPSSLRNVAEAIPYAPKREVNL